MRKKDARQLLPKVMKLTVNIVSWVNYRGHEQREQERENCRDIHELHNSQLDRLSISTDTIFLLVLRDFLCYISSSFKVGLSLLNFNTIWTSSHL